MLSRYSWVASERSRDSIGPSYPDDSGVDEDLAVPHDHRERVDPLRCRQRQRLAGTNVECRAVPWALDAKAITVAPAKWPVVVAAAVLDRVVRAVDQVHTDEERARLDDLDAALGDLPLGGYPDFHSIPSAGSSHSGGNGLPVRSLSATLS